MQTRTSIELDSQVAEIKSLWRKRPLPSPSRGPTHAASGVPVCGTQERESSLPDPWSAVLRALDAGDLEEHSELDLDPDTFFQEPETVTVPEPANMLDPGPAVSESASAPTAEGVLRRCQKPAEEVLSSSATVGDSSEKTAVCCVNAKRSPTETDVRAVAETASKTLANCAKWLELQRQANQLVDRLGWDAVFGEDDAVVDLSDTDTVAEETAKLPKSPCPDQSLPGTSGSCSRPSTYVEPGFLEKVRARVDANPPEAVMLKSASLINMLIAVVSLQHIALCLSLCQGQQALAEKTKKKKGDKQKALAEKTVKKKGDKQKARGMPAGRDYM